MTNALLSPTLPLNLPLQTSGRVADILSDGSLIVESAGRGWHCRRAASCLLTPESGDVVLLARSDDDKLWLLAVLERAQPELTAQLSVNGDLAISARGGLTLSGERQLALDSQTLRVTADDGECAIRHLAFQSDEVSARVRIGRWLGDRCESVWHTLTQISQLSFRQVKQTEHVRAGQLDYQAEDYARLHARSTLITADTITKIDSEQIHVG
ncbi:DUF3540 domain-containing protein [Enterobacillus tribolii]|uniref:Uncharacterized protein DUF3540 n=1 Tax=Enterobacillus tribolii TaxID=1487935 RepID=A0A370QS55_9GAMM|nr:DUF3540 domain-containing protein [Enterobacillus tribolii]MBW7983724.1 DUF3540 domain-containing protein [Enterobacillus tribolii]RDK92088.1 uncharacterized protein DUF3540 [Enterobacillus tribolii]